MSVPDNFYEILEGICQKGDYLVARDISYECYAEDMIDERLPLKHYRCYRQSHVSAISEPAHGLYSFPGKVPAKEGDEYLLLHGGKWQPVPAENIGEIYDGGFIVRRPETLGVSSDITALVADIQKEIENIGINFGIIAKEFTSADQKQA